MNGFLLDENLPAHLRCSPSLPVFRHSQAGPQPSDSDLWDFARKNRLVIVSKDADFSERIIAQSPPPWVVHLRFGNMKLAEYHQLLARLWPQVEALLKSHKLVNVYTDRLEGIG